MQYCHRQDSMKSYWSYGYAEQACAKECQGFMEKLKQGKSCDLLVVGSALAKIPAWKESLRPGQTSGLEDRVKSCLLDWMEALLSECPSPSPTIEDAEGAATRKHLVQVLDFAKQVPFVFPKAAGEFNPWIEKLAEKLKAVEQGALQTKLDDSVSKLLQDGVSETSLECFLSSMRETNGMTFKSVSEEDCLLFRCFACPVFCTCRFQIPVTVTETVAAPARSIPFESFEQATRKIFSKNALRKSNTKSLGVKERPRP